MDFLQKMISYYQNESGHDGLKVIASTVLLLFLGAFFSWKFAGPLSILKGLTIPLIIGGLFFGIAGAASGIYTKRNFVEKLKVYEHDRPTFFKEEVPRVEKIHKSWFGVRALWAVVAVSGLGLLLFAKKNYLMGVGMGILIVGLMGQLVEAFSFHRNEEYRNAVLEAAKRDQTDQNDQPKSDHKSIEPSINIPSEKKEERPFNKENKSSATFESPGIKDGFHLNVGKLILIHTADFPDSTLKNKTAEGSTPDSERVQN